MLKVVVGGRLGDGAAAAVVVEAEAGLGEKPTLTHNYMSTERMTQLNTHTRPIKTNTNQPTIDQQVGKPTSQLDACLKSTRISTATQHTSAHLACTVK